MFKLGLTGGIATGKSTVSNYFKELGIPVLDADVIAREVVMPGEPALADIVAIFGDDMLQSDGTLNRAALGAKVFGRPTALSKLNAITHPRIQARMRQQIEELAAQDVAMVVLDVPLLIEGNNAINADAIMVVAVPENIQLERLMARNKLTQLDAQARIDSQLPLTNKIAVADYVIDNAGTIAQTTAQVDAVLQQILS